VDHILDTPGESDADRVAMLGKTAAKLLGIASQTHRVNCGRRLVMQVGACQRAEKP
jgi:hypothetical protein